MFVDASFVLASCFSHDFVAAFLDRGRSSLSMQLSHSTFNACCKAEHPKRVTRPKTIT